MASKVRDSVVVITGARSGIGRATALAFPREGASVVLTGRRDGALNELARECERLGGRALAVQADVTDRAALDRVASSTVDRFGRIDVWFNNAAVTVAGNFEEIPPDD